ncbi:hypothetical protein BJV78DRAFT_1279153 [Lactifluus subvellereus]|nr:hypothetical protein BJV78DRAFT_1279153 [Lactifluus subvellereus]
MGRTFTPAVTAAPVIVDPTESHDDMYPHYPCWSYENAWDPDSEAFFKDAVYEDFVPVLPLEPITPVDSSDGSTTGSSGRDTPAELPPAPGQVSPSGQDVSRWLQFASPSSDTTAFDGFLPLPTPRRHSTSELRRGAPQSPAMSSAAFERLHARQLSRARVAQHFAALLPDGDSDMVAPASLRPAVSVHTSEITPIQLPSSHPRSAALQRQILLRSTTPPPAPMPSVPFPIMSPSGEALQPSPPPSVSPRIYNWTTAAHPAPESPTVPSRMRVAPARWPVY